MLSERFETPATPCSLSSGPRVVCTKRAGAAGDDPGLELAAASRVKSGRGHRQVRAASRRPRDSPRQVVSRNENAGAIGLNVPPVSTSETGLSARMASGKCRV